ncbi:hypothetical protein ACS126_09695 [Sphingobacterium lactis]|uniref:hypothetical protein n=1 Tax=Sphingobacterium lactis TaxID=797291 RepID=UPI003EC618F7
MNLIIPKIEIETLSAREMDYYQELDNTPYGQTLALKITDKLKLNPTEMAGLYFSHRDYCGMGLFIKDGLFLLADVHDGWGANKTIASWSSALEFADWLSKENDQSMSLYGESFNNQTITKLRLEWYLEENYDNSNTAYALYLESRRQR